MPSLADFFPLPPIARHIGEVMRHAQRPANATEALALSALSVRSGLFFAESLPLFLIAAPFSDAFSDASSDAKGRSERAPDEPEPNSRFGSGRTERGRPPQKALEDTFSRLFELLKRDAALIGQGDAPLSVLTPQDPLSHGMRLLRILADGTAVGKRRRTHSAREFTKDARRWLDELPAYYRRNFHYQTDGYLSAHSAALYEHQVELLFRGGADPMRRMIIPPLRAHLQRAGASDDGAGLHFLELGSGTGSATRSVARCFPKAKITCVDLSPPYTRHARQQLDEFPRVNCIQGDAAELDFADQRFDAVYSVFLFHELPLPVREAVLAETMRVLRPGGFFGLVDSLQRGDDDELDWALEFFPREFHEPYYANYAANPMSGLLSEAGFEGLEAGTGYLAKWVAAVAPTESEDSVDTATQPKLSRPCSQG